MRRFQPGETLDRVRRALRDDRQWLASLDRAPAIHLAVLVEPYLGHVLAGRKTVESRFTKHRTTPFRMVSAGDIVFLKRSGGPVVGVIRVRAVEYVVLSAATWPRVRKLGNQLCADATFWEDRINKTYASLLHVGAVTPMEPVTVRKRDRRPWVVLKPA